MARQAGGEVLTKQSTGLVKRSLSEDQLVEFYRLMYLSRRDRRPRDRAEAAAEDLLSDLLRGA